MSKLTHEVMHGCSAWSEGDRALMATFVAKTNQCEFLYEAHSAVAQRCLWRREKRFPRLEYQRGSCIRSLVYSRISIRIRQRQRNLPLDVLPPERTPHVRIAEPDVIVERLPLVDSFHP